MWSPAADHGCGASFPDGRSVALEVLRPELAALPGPERLMKNLLSWLDLHVVPCAERMPVP